MGEGEGKRGKRREKRGRGGERRKGREMPP